MSAASNGLSKSAQIRARLNHPVIDADGHSTEFEPAFLDYLKEVGGAGVVERYKAIPDSGFRYTWHQLGPQQRLEHRSLAFRPLWWAHPKKNTLDNATTTIPRLHYQRMDEFGIDFAVIYPSIGLLAPHISDQEIRLAACRAFNKFNADIYGEFSDRLTPVAVIPANTPQEALDELEYAVGVRKMKAVQLPAFINRPIPTLARKAPEMAGLLTWVDNLCIDSEYDYDPVWAKCQKLRVAPTFHTVTVGVGSRATISNFMFNFVGHFAASAEVICKALLMGGVTRRFPRLNFAFQEAGVAWAAHLYGGLHMAWATHNVGMIRDLDPANLDRAMFEDLCRKHGGPLYAERVHRLWQGDASDLLLGTREDDKDLDEWAAAGIRTAEDIRERFVRPFYFGCEGEDLLNVLAFRNPYGCRFNAVFGSDIGHFDVPDQREAAAEAYELVEKGLISEDDYRDLVFANPVRLHGGVNPDFFKGTRVEREAGRLLAASQAAEGAQAAAVGGR